MPTILAIVPMIHQCLRMLLVASQRSSYLFQLPLHQRRLFRTAIQVRQMHIHAHAQSSAGAQRLVCRQGAGDGGLFGCRLAFGSSSTLLFAIRIDFMIVCCDIIITSCRMSHVTRHTSHVTRHTSHEHSHYVTQDIEEMVGLGKRLTACPYYASRCASFCL